MRQLAVQWCAAWSNADPRLAGVDGWQVMFFRAFALCVAIHRITPHTAVVVVTASHHCPL